MTKTVFLTFAVAASILLAAAGGILLRGADAPFLAPSAYAPPGMTGDEASTPATQTRELAMELAEELHLDILEKVAGGLAPAAGSSLASGPEERTLYLHSTLAVGDPERVTAAIAGALGPSMDETPPSGTTSKVQSLGADAAPDYRKNYLMGWFAADLHGTVSDITLTLFVQGSGKIEASLYGDGAVGPASPLARVTVPFDAPTPGELVITFPGASFDVKDEMVLSLRGLMGPTGTTGMPQLVYYDSAAHPSAMSLTLSPAVESFKLNDPAGIAFRAGRTVVMNAGTGEIVELDGTEGTVVASGFYAAGFLRGLGDAVADGDGNVYFAETDTGKVHVLRPDGSTGVYAKDLGAPKGLAFDDSGDLFVGDAGSGTIFRVSPGGATAVLARLPRAGVFDLALAPDGTLTASTFRPGFLHSVDVDTGEVLSSTLLNASATAEGLAYDSAGHLYVGSASANASGRILRIAPDSTVEVVSTTIGGPIHLAFLPGESALVVASQGELGGGDRVLTLETPLPGAPVATPSVPLATIADGWQGWVHDRLGRPLPASAFDATLPVGELVDTGHEASEPTMGIQTDGDLFVVAGVSHKTDVVTGVPTPDILRSDDNGRTWTSVHPRIVDLRHPEVSADVFVHVDQDTGRVFSFDLLAACNYLSYSDDDGRTWTTNPLACGEPPVDHQSLVTAPPRVTTTLGYPNILYSCSNVQVLSPCGRSLDGGDTWQPTGPAFVNVRTAPVCNAGGLPGHLGADLEGRVMVGKSMCGVPYVAITEDDGLTWKEAPLNLTAGISGHDIDFAVDSENNLYAAWLTPAGQIVYVASTDHGATWGPAHRVSPSTIRMTQMPTMAAGGPGRLVFNYMGSNTDYGYATQNAGKTSWNAYLTVTVDGLSATPTFATVTAHSISDPIVRGSCARPCSGVWDFLDVRIAPDGRAWGTSIDACLGACVTDRSAPPLAFANIWMATLSAGPDLHEGDALAPR